MKKLQKSTKKNIINVTIILLISIAITFLFAGSNGKWQDIILNIVYGAIIGLSIAPGSGYISKKMLSNDNWIEKPVRRFVSVIIAVSLYIIVDVVLINIVWFSITQDRGVVELFQSNFFIWIILIELMVGLMIYLIIVSIRFARSLNEFYMETEDAKRELNQYKYAVLKNQVNPHFLFNSLNVLSGIIYSDVEKADDFIAKFSNIYRYILDVQDEEVVDVKQEITFAQDYLFLQAIRFGDDLQYDIQVTTNKMMIPMGLQILIENVLKHNIISSDNKLLITIYNDENYLTVKNNIQLKNVSEVSHELGLKNIKGRYKFLTDNEVEINSTKDYFEVRLPLLDFQS